MPGIDRRLIQNFEWPVLFLGLLLGGMGVVNLMSAASVEGVEVSPIALRQLSWLGIGLAAVVAVLIPDYRQIERVVPAFYVIGVALLALVLVAGDIVNGSQRWLVLGPARLQPSELFKLVMVLVAARYLSRRGTRERMGFLDLGLPAIVIAVPAYLVLKQPDLGTALSIVLAAGTFVLVANVRARILFFGGLGGVVAVALAWFFYLHDYQKDRVFAFLNPESDPLGAAYHAIQSQIAIGSGAVFGKGWQQGSQTQLDFLPEQQTDFVFSVLGEEWGFVGASFVLVLYVALMVRGLMIARASKDVFGAYLALGIVGMFFWAATINVGMVIGIMPVVGVPLPLFSYGGSSLLTCMLGIGLLMNVSMRRYTF